MQTTFRRAFGAGLVAVLVGLATPAAAGPPLICFPFEVGAAAVLPWGDGPGWNAPKAGYDTARLTADTLRLLTPDAPVLARMENLRRAAIYAMQDPALANELLSAVIGRALSTSKGGTSLAWFDAGYLVETYRQAVPIRAPTPRNPAGWTMVDATIAVDGYGFVKKALMLAGTNAEMEFAASLMTTGAVAAEHRARAAKMATRGSLLAINLVK